MAKNIVDSFQNLTQAGGVVNQNSYPVDFQATEFPQLARDGDAVMMGNNLAYFFSKANGNPPAPQLDTTHLKKLMESMIKNESTVTLMMDDDVITNPERFIDKYQQLRPETDETARRTYLKKEIGLIADFLNNGGVSALLKEVVRESERDLSEKECEVLASNILSDKKFSILGVKTNEALKAAVWDVAACAVDKDDRLIASQIYSPSTANTDRKWMLANEKSPALTNDHPLKKHLEEIRRLKQTARNLTLGDLGQSQSRSLA